MNNVASISIYDLSLEEIFDTRIANLFLRNGINKLEDIENLSDDELKKLEAFEPGQYDEVKDILENRKSYKICKLTTQEMGFTARTANALMNCGICTAEELNDLPESDLGRIRGLGAKALDEIKDYRATHSGVRYHLRRQYLPSEILTQKEVLMAAAYYNDPRATLQSISENKDITRERVRQIIAKAVAKIRKCKEHIRTDYLESIERYADMRTEIRTIELTDGAFNSIGLTRLFSEAWPQKYEIIKDRRLNGLWLVRTEDNVLALFNKLYDELKYSPAPLYIPDIIELYSITEEMIWSINGVVEKDGYITLGTNRVSTGKDRVGKTTEFLVSINRPASIWQIAEGTGMTLNQVRGALQTKGHFVNVGKSIYDLSDRDYSEASIEDLAKNILHASDRALKINNILEYIRRYRAIGCISVEWALGDSSDFYEWDGYYLLKDWPLSMIKKATREIHSIRVKDAVLELINSSDEIFDFELVRDRLVNSGIDVTTNPSSIKATLAKLAADNEIRRVWGSNGCYMHN